MRRGSCFRGTQHRPAYRQSISEDDHNGPLIQLSYSTHSTSVAHFSTGARTISFLSSSETYETCVS